MYLYVYRLHMDREKKEGVGLGKANDLQGKFIALHVLLRIHQYSNWGNSTLIDALLLAAAV